MESRIVAMVHSVLLATLLAAGLAAYAASPAVKQTQVGTPKRVLLFGNSYNYYGSASKQDTAFLHKAANKTV